MIYSRYSLFWLIFFFAGTLIAVIPFPTIKRSPEHWIIPVAASSFEFMPGVIRVDPGDRVTIQLTSTDVVHGLYLDGYGLQINADPGQTSSLTFVADQPGTFRFRCAVTCGDMHPFMIGKLQVGPPILFWRGISMALLIVLALRSLPAVQGSDFLKTKQ